MKLKKELCEVRERFALDLFLEDPDLGIPTANRLVRDRFGSMIRVQKMYELRKRVKENPKAARR